MSSSLRLSMSSLETPAAVAQQVVIGVALARADA
jgi:hypothetical protein